MPNSTATAPTGATVVIRWPVMATVVVLLARRATLTTSAAINDSGTTTIATMTMSLAAWVP